jgi:DNA primase
MNIDPSTTKYLIRAKLLAEGVVEKPDVVGAIFGQTEGLIGEELDLRDLQKSGRMGRIEVELKSSKGKSEGIVTMPSSLDQVETAILASALETIDRIGPCKAKIDIESIEDVRAMKKQKIIERAKVLLSSIIADSKSAGVDLLETVRQAVQVEEIMHYGKDKCPAGPNIDTSDAIIVVEGRSDVLNLLKYGIKNAIAVEGTNIPRTIQDLSKERIVTAFVDGDRGGELILRELLQVAEVDFIARAPKGQEVEELTQKMIMKLLRNKIPAEQFIEMYALNDGIKDAYQKGRESEARNNIQQPQQQTGRNYNKDTRSSYNGKKDKDFEKRGFDQGKPETRPQEQNEPYKNKSHDKRKKKLSSKQLNYKDVLTKLTGSLKANLMNDKDELVKDIAVRDLPDTLKKTPKGTTTVVFDGVITQRLLDIAFESDITTIVGMKVGNITKQPESIEVYSKQDLE